MAPVLEAVQPSNRKIVGHRGYDAAVNGGCRIRGCPGDAVQVAGRLVAVGSAAERDWSVVSSVLGGWYGGMDYGSCHEIYGGMFVRCCQNQCVDAEQWTPEQARDFIRKMQKILRDGEQRIYHEV
jgi:hypothetical protein